MDLKANHAFGTGLAGDLKRDLDDIFYSQANYPRIVSGVNATVIGESPQ